MGDIIITLYFFVLGAILGSFVNAYSWRLHNRLIGKKPTRKAPQSVLNGRSICESCGHQLSWHDLIPIVSWLSLRGRCRYCGKPVSIQNPLMEIGMSLAFGLSFMFWPEPLSGYQIAVFGVWLALLVGMGTLIVHDARWLLLPNAVIYPMIITAMALVLSDAFFGGESASAVRDAVLGLGVVGGFFYLLFAVSGGRWIGGGDVKLAIFIGILLGLTKGLVALYVGFITASLVVLPLLILKKMNRRQQLPFGPFLLLGIFVAQLWGAELIDWYSTSFLITY